MVGWPMPGSHTAWLGSAIRLLREEVEARAWQVRGFPPRATKTGEFGVPERLITTL